VHGNDLYGTPRLEVDPYRVRGIGVVLVIDVQGAGQIRAAYPGDHYSVFINAPSMEELEARLRHRNTETEDKVVRRLEEARKECARAGEFDRQLINRDLDQTVRDLERVIREQFSPRGY
jgi:guanylate kinase